MLNPCMIAGTVRCCDVRGISHHPIHRNLEDSDKSCLGSTDKTLLRAPSKTFISIGTSYQITRTE
jgi:hypothetical protein